MKIRTHIRQMRSERAQRGQSLVEFAISLMILLILVAGVVDGARALFTYMGLRDAAQEGALYGSISPDDAAGIEARVFATSDLLEGLESDPTVVVTISYPDGAPNCHGKAITVRVEMDFDLAMPLIGTIVGGQTIPISAEITDTILIPPCP